MKLVNFLLTFRPYSYGMNSIEARLEQLYGRKALEDIPRIAAEARKAKAAALRKRKLTIKEQKQKQRQKELWLDYCRRCRRKGWSLPVSDLPEKQVWSQEFLRAEQLKAEAKAAGYTRGPYNKRPAWSTKKYDAARERAEWLEDKARQEVEEAAADVKFQQDLRALKERQEREAQRCNAA